MKRLIKWLTKADKKDISSLYMRWLAGLEDHSIFR